MGSSKNQVLVSKGSMRGIVAEIGEPFKPTTTSLFKWAVTKDPFRKENCFATFESDSSQISIGSPESFQFQAYPLSLMSQIGADCNS